MTNGNALTAARGVGPRIEFEPCRPMRSKMHDGSTGGSRPRRAALTQIATSVNSLIARARLEHARRQTDVAADRFKCASPEGGDSPGSPGHAFG